MEEDGVAWLVWAKNHGRLEVLSRAQVMTLDNQPAIIKTGRTVPTVTPVRGTDGSAEDDQIEPTEVGLTVSVNSRISPEGLVLMELEVEHATAIDRDGEASPIIGKTTFQTTISAKDGLLPLLLPVNEVSPGEERRRKEKST